MFRLVVLALSVLAVSAAPGYLGGSFVAGPAVASPVLASPSIAYGGLGAPIATSYGLNTLGYSGLGLRTGLIGNPLASPIAAGYGYGSPYGLRSAIPLSYGAYGIGAYGSPLIH